MPLDSTRLLPSADPCLIIIFGASGDLARRKLVPALFNLACAGCTTNNFQVLGIGRTKMDDNAFRQQLYETIKQVKDVNNLNEDSWKEFANRLSYMVGDPGEEETLRKLAVHLEAMHKSGASYNYLFYLSVPPSIVPSIIEGLGRVGLAREEKGWRRIIIEKPFGRDLISAHTLNEQVAEVFHEHQVYRIDHYLGKETVQNILVFRFGNSLFEPVWNRNYIDYVEITAAETLGIGSRASYYEETGAMRDMVANHLLQLLTLTAMDPPVAFDADSVRGEKVQVLRSIRPMKPEDVIKKTVRGQYISGRVDGKEVLGYKDEVGVSKSSNTETFAAIEFRIENWRWAGVPFYVRTGKRLARNVTEVAIHLKRPPLALFSRNGSSQIEPNIILLRIQPDEGISVKFEAKRPGPETRTSTVQMDFHYQSAFEVQVPAAYQTLLLDAMRGDGTLFTRHDEVEAEWKLITPIEEVWADKRMPEMQTYEAGSSGPKCADELLARNGHQWRHI
jgi:glucose-6-phosphate 1-dehydrogenase